MSKLLASFDQMPRKAIALTNLALGVFFGLLPAVMARVLDIPSPLLAEMMWVVDGVAIGGGLIVPAAALALFAPGVERIAFLAHALGVLILVSTLVGWAVSLIVHGLPPGVGFSWSPGLLTGLAAWAAFVAGRALVSPGHDSPKVRAYAVLLVGLVVLPIDIGAMIRLFADVFKHWHGGGA